MRPVVELTEVTKIYGSGENAVRALDEVTLTIERGEFVARERVRAGVPRRALVPALERSVRLHDEVAHGDVRDPVALHVRDRGRGPEAAWDVHHAEDRSGGRQNGERARAVRDVFSAREDLGPR